MVSRSDALTRSYEMEPLDGDPAGIRRHANRYTRVAEKVAQAVADLRSTIADAESHESDAMDELARQADDVIPKLSKIQNRYEVAGSELATFADVLEQAQATVDASLRTRESLAADLARYDAQITEAQSSLAWAPTEEIEQRRDELVRLENTAAPMAQSLADARTAYDGALEDVRTAGDKAEDAINEAVDADGLTDSRWDRFKSWVTENVGWIKVLKDALSIIATVLGVLSIFFPVLLPFAVAFAAATLLLSTTLAATGNGSWLDVGLDTVALLTLGVGAAIGSGVKLAQGALRVTRSARLAWAGASRPGVFGSLLRPVRAGLRYGDDAVRVADDLAQAMPTGVRLLGRPTYGSLDDAWRVFRGGGVDGAVFRSIAENATLGAGGLVDDVLLGAGRSMANASFANNLVGLAGTAVSWHDDLINGNILNVSPGLRDLPDAFGGDLLGRYGDWWSEVDGATFDVVGEWDPAGKS
ncbi:hypothetical protein [Isoptericola variabilis]|uniref:Uncharacterized protein n=1 Tax=Isoptericola variabilis (strain 225) TaxID=743718 RepID=F6FVQ0_ISOV2|nr:hypothetical protein [Isoptericola variabilis]AEG45551.1 hypothetical protein Isova_2865 [Isoptericola variabilis 225]TWH25845.1 t-SNARE complex subunit (syntaxin) [Isoptericola variabilis J7]